MVEGARLESVYTGNCIEGSNPFLSATRLNEKNLTKSGFFMPQFDSGTLVPREKWGIKNQGTACPVFPVLILLLPPPGDHRSKSLGTAANTQRVEQLILS